MTTNPVTDVLAGFLFSVALWGCVECFGVWTTAGGVLALLGLSALLPQ